MKKVVESLCCNISAKLLVSMIVFAFVCFAAEDGRAVDIAEMRGILTDASSEHDKLAADTLARYLERIYGVKIPVNPDGIKALPDERDIILVGRKTALAAGTITAKELEKVKHDGFVLRAGEGRISLAGYRPRGTIYAAYELLEQTGCRFFTRNVEIVPKLPDSVIQAIDIADKPVFDFRFGRLWPFRHSVNDIGDPCDALDPELFKGTALYLDQTAAYLVPPALYYDEHPEYYAVRADGKRMPGDVAAGRVVLCLSNAKALDIATKRTLGWMRKQPERRFFFVTQHYNYDWCQCKECRAMDVDYGNYSDRILKWVNHIARAVRDEFPKNMILTYATDGSDMPPVKERPGKNVCVMYAQGWGLSLYNALPISHPANAGVMELFEGWRETATDNIGIIDFTHWVPVEYRALSENLRWYADRGVKSVWFRRSSPFFNDLYSYLCGKLLWNPYLDMDKLVQEFVPAYYGAAGPVMLRYLELVMENIPDSYPSGPDDNLSTSVYYNTDFMTKTLAMFDEMRTITADDPVFAGRIDKEFTLFIKMYLRAVPVGADPFELADKFLKTPSDIQAAHHPESSKTEPEILATGVRLPATAFEGGYGPGRYSWYCEPRTGMAVYSPASGRPFRMRAEFEIEYAPSGPVKLEIEGQDSDKEYPPPTSIRITINGIAVFEGPCGFAKRGWSKRVFTIDAGVLKQGGNVLEISNMMETFRTDQGWFYLSEAEMCW